MYAAVFVLLVVNGASRAGYLAPAYTWLSAAGAVALDGLFSRFGGSPARAVVVALVLAEGVLLAPFGLPVLPIDRYVAYARTLGIGPSTEEKKDLGVLPQHYADMHGWDAIVGAVAAAYETIPVEDRAATTIFTPNYGDAGAIELLGMPRGLPQPVSGHNNYWLWGPPSYDVRTVIVLGGQYDQLVTRYRQVRLAGRTNCGLCMPDENDQPIWICSGPLEQPQTVWPRLKHYD